MKILYVPFDPADPSHVKAVASIWTAACGPDLAISERFARFNTRPSLGVVQGGQLALAGDQPAGFVLASMLAGEPAVSPPQVGYIDAIGALPRSHGQGIGSTLLSWAEGWLRGQGCVRIRLGSGLRPFVPGLPVSLDGDSFFGRRGYGGHPNYGDRSWDVALRPQRLRYAADGTARCRLPRAAGGTRTGRGSAGLFAPRVRWPLALRV